VQNCALYASAAPTMRPGDIIACSGTALISHAIQVVTGSPITHVMTVRQAIHAGDPISDVVVTQATMGGGEPNGAQSDPLGQVLASQYANGRAWLLTLAPSVRAKVDWFKFYQFIGACEGRVKYDWWGLVLYRLGLRAQVNPKAMFCNEYAIAIMQACGSLPPAGVGVNPREQTPQAFVSMPLFSACRQIWGPAGAISWGRAG
jgi:hypothetical protein